MELFDALIGWVEEASAITYDQLPAPTAERIGLVVADTIGVAIAGMTRSATGRSLRALTLSAPDYPPRPRTSDASELFLLPTMAVGAVQASFLNASAGTALELDEGCRPVGHPAVHVVPAAIAVGQAIDCGGSEVLAAIAAGYEVAARLYSALPLQYPVHPHGYVGGIGAAVAVGMLAGVSVPDLVTLVASQPPLTLWSACQDGGNIRNLYAGRGAAAAVSGLDLLSAGFQSTPAVPRESFQQLSGNSASLFVDEQPIDVSKLRIDQNYFKFHSACALIHGALDAVASLAPYNVREIRCIDIYVGSRAYRLRELPVTGELAPKFSIPHCVAEMIIHGRTLLPDQRPSESVSEVASQIRVHHEIEFDQHYPGLPAARVVIRERQASREAMVTEPHGGRSSPCTKAELREKFLYLTGAHRGGLFDLLSQLERFNHISGLISRFTETPGLRETDRD